MILVTLPKPAFTNWTLSGSLKPLLILGAAGTSSVALVSSISKSEQTQKNFKDALDTLATPFKPFAEKLAKGSVQMFNGLADWAKYGRPVVSAIAESFTSGSVSTGSRAIFHKLKEWWDSIYWSIKTYGPWLFSKELWSKLNSFSQILKNLLKADMKGNAPLLFSLFRAAGKEKFTDFMDKVGEFADKQKETFDKLGGAEMQDLLNAFEGDPEGTQKILEDFSKKPNNENLKDELMKALKPATLKGRIKVAIDKANVYINKGKLSNAEDRKGAEAARKEIQDIRQELQDIIAQARKGQQK